MRWFSVFSLGLSMWVMAACRADDGLELWTPSGLLPASDDTLVLPEPACKGICVPRAPATFSGPSLFWWGSPFNVPPCPPETPIQGIQGYLVGGNPRPFVRECLITPSDLCDVEGMICVPAPREGYHMCVHNEHPCTAQQTYEEASTMTELGTGTVLALCCDVARMSG